MLGFSVWIEISLVLCGGIEIDLIFEWASISLNCGSGVEINFIVRDRILPVSYTHLTLPTIYSV